MTAVVKEPTSTIFSNEVVLLQLITGAMVIGKVSLGSNSSTITIKKPAAILMGMDQQTGKGIVHLSDFLPFSEDTPGGKEVTFALNHVLFFSSPAKEMFNSYNTTFGSGIVIPEQALHTNHQIPKGFKPKLVD